MKKKYDFKDSRKNPYAAHLKKQITIRLDETVLHYFKTMAAETEIPYQTLINLYLRDCAQKKRRISLRWARKA